MSTENKEFYDLLNSLVDEQTFSLDLCPRAEAKTINCKQLSTSQLTELIKTVVDSPLTQAAFNSTATKVFKQSLVEQPDVPLNVVDRLLFILETRIQSLSPTMTIEEEDKKVTVNIQEVKANLLKSIKENAELFAPSSATEGKITVGFDVALLDAESQLNDEVYKNLDINIENVDELRKMIGDAFINEIAKTVQKVTIGDKTLDLSTVTFKSRLKTIESLPASLIRRVIEYIERYKKIIDGCLTVDGLTIPVDGSLFSLR